MRVYHPSSILLALAMVCFIATFLLERWARRTSVWLTEEEWPAYLRAHPGSRHATNPVFTAAGERAHRLAGRLFWLGLAFGVMWLVLN